MDFFASKPIAQATPNGGLQGFDKLQSIAGRSANGKKLSDEEMREVGTQFESLLLHQLLTTMRKTIQKSDLFGESSAQRIYDDMFDEKMAATVAESGQTGLANAIIEEIKRQQEAVSLPDKSEFLSLVPEATQFRPVSNATELKPLDREEPVAAPPPFDRTRFFPLPGRQVPIGEVDTTV